MKNPQACYCTRKGMYAFLCIAMVDLEMEFRWADFRHGPATHDGLASSVKLRRAPFGAQIIAGAMPYAYFINGDASFIAGPSMVVPLGLANFDYLRSSKKVMSGASIRTPCPSLGDLVEAPRVLLCTPHPCHHCVHEAPQFLP